MTDRASSKRPAAKPVRWRARARQTVAVTSVVTLGVGGFLVTQAATGHDPALSAIAAKQQARQYAAADAAARAAARLPARRRIVIRRVVVTRVVTDPPAVTAQPTVARTAAAAPQVSYSAPAPQVQYAPAPPAYSPPPPVVSSGS